MKKNVRKTTWVLMVGLAIVCAATFVYACTKEASGDSEDAGQAATNTPVAQKLQYTLSACFLYYCPPCSGWYDTNGFVGDCNRCEDCGPFCGIILGKEDECFLSIVEPDDGGLKCLTIPNLDEVSDYCSKLLLEAVDDGYVLFPEGVVIEDTALMATLHADYVPGGKYPIRREGNGVVITFKK